MLARSGGTTSRPEEASRSSSRRGAKNLSALHTHEAVCAERYANIMTLLELTMRRVGRLETLVIIVAGSVISGLGGVIVTLALKLGTR